MTGRVAAWTAFNSRDLRLVRRLVAEVERPCRLGEPEASRDADARRASRLLDGLDGHDALEEARASAPRAPSAEALAALDDRTRRALAVAMAGGDGLGDVPDPAVIAEARAALGVAA
jgi:hypothetical protein